MEKIASRTAARSFVPGPARARAVGPYETVPGAFKYDGPDIQLALGKATDVAVVHGTMAPGGTIGWHSHPDVVFVTVTEGDMTLYDAGDPSCTP